MSLHDLRFSPNPNSKSRLCLSIKPSAICIPHTGRGILALLAHLHEWLLTTLQRCKATKYTLHCSQSKISLVWKYGMEMEWKKIASMEYGKIVFHSIPYHALAASEENKKDVWKFSARFLAFSHEALTVQK